MSDFYAFADKHPWVVFGLAVLSSMTLSLPFSCVLRLYSRRCRSMNIIAQGWPPAHLNADGYAIEWEKKEGNE